MKPWLVTGCTPLFDFGLATFLSVTDHVQRPYLQLSSKRWPPITGLRGYLSSAIFTLALKILAPLMAVYVVWYVVGLPALVSVAPFLLGCGAQLTFEAQLEKRKSSCWPLVPIIFEVYRLYQLSRATNFIERLMMEMKGMTTTPDLLERSGALFSMVVVFQVLGLVCLWFLITILLRLFPSRPVSESCPQLAALEQGKWVHADIDKNGMRLTDNLGAALIDMFAKCGRVEIALELFCKLDERNISAWNALITGLAINGDSLKSIEVFEEM